MESLMKPTSLSLAIATGLLLASWHAFAVTPSPSTAVFDEHVAAGLPRAFSLPRPPDDPRGEGVDQVMVEERLDADVVYPDGSHATTYIGTANGIEATFVRLGDALDVSVFEDMNDAAESKALRRVRRSAVSEPDDVVLSTAPLLPTASALSSVQARELQFWIFLHDDSGESDYAKFHSWYIAWWIRDMERNIKPGVPVKVFVKDKIPGVTDFDYKPGEYHEALKRFSKTADNYLKGQGIVPWRLTKTMLFIRERPTSWDGIYGVAEQGWTAAMASGTGPRHIVAHEFGHTLDAKHAYGELRFPCVTNMMDWVIPYHSCRIYSGMNDDQIRNHVRDTLRAVFDE
jgi:hypothetical protein